MAVDIQAHEFGYIQHVENRGLQQRGVRALADYLDNIQSNIYNWAQNSIGWLQELPELSVQAASPIYLGKKL